jgi:transposase-like protein
LWGVAEREIPSGDLVGASEIAERLGLAHSTTVHSWRVRYRASDDPFPEPVTKVAGAYLWSWLDVRRWCERTGKPDL